MKRSILTSVLAASMLGGLTSAASAAVVTNPSGNTTADSGAAGSGLASVQINGGNGNSSGSGTGGETTSATGWSATADGSLYANVLNLASVDSRTYTRLDTNGVTFGTSTDYGGLTGNLLNLVNLQNIADFGAAQVWTATVVLNSQGIVLANNTQYQLSFTYQNLTGLLNGADPSIFDHLTVTIRDNNSDFRVANSSDGLLGIINLNDNSGLLTVNFTTDANINGNVEVFFSATGLQTGSTDLPVLQTLLDHDNTTDLYRLSGFNVNAVPEASHGMLAMMSLLAVLRWRRR